MYRVQIRNEADPDSVDIYIDSGIEHNLEGCVSVKSLREQLQDKPFIKVILHVNSEGGDLFEGLAIYNYLNELIASGHEVEAVIEGICSSSASVAVMAANKISMYRTSYMFIHKASMYVEDGSEDKLKEYSDMIFDLNNKIASIYAKRSGLSELAITDIMNKESWLSAETCKTLGLCDEVIDTPPVKSESETRIENRIKDSANIRVTNTYKRPDNTEIAIRNMAKIINAKRGYK